METAGRWASYSSPSAAGDVPLGGKATDLESGAHHVCAILESGKLVCWGKNTEGQLGLGHKQNIGDDETPEVVGEVNLGARPIQMGLGSTETCVVVNGGGLRCWGHYGGLAYGDGNRKIGVVEVPAQAGDALIGGPVVQASAGLEFACALMQAGTVRCWGGMRFPLGWGEPRPQFKQTPAQLGDISIGGKVVQIATGGQHICARLEGGSVRCWGSGGSGRLGYASMAKVGETNTPAQVGDVQLGGNAAAVAAGVVNTCAILSEGRLRCWGYGAEGALGYGNRNDVGDDEIPAAAGDVPVGGRVAQVACGRSHTCVLLESGTIRCWGNGGKGATGYGRPEKIGDDEPASAAPETLVF